MTAVTAFFCAHKRLRTACPDCTPVSAERPSAIDPEMDKDFPRPRIAPRRTRRESGVQ